MEAVKLKLYRRETTNDVAIRRNLGKKGWSRARSTCGAARWIGPLPSSYPIRSPRAKLRLIKGTEVMRALCRLSSPVLCAIVVAVVATKFPSASLAQERSVAQREAAAGALITQPVDETQLNS